MTKPFVPARPEKTIRVEVTAKEGHLLKCLRQYSFGKFTIHKANGKLVRIEASESILLTEEEGEKLVFD